MIIDVASKVPERTTCGIGTRTANPTRPAPSLSEMTTRPMKTFVRGARVTGRMRRLGPPLSRQRPCPMQWVESGHSHLGLRPVGLVLGWEGAGADFVGIFADRLADLAGEVGVALDEARSALEQAEHVLGD